MLEVSKIWLNSSDEYPDLLETDHLWVVFNKTFNRYVKKDNIILNKLPLLKFREGGASSCKQKGQLDLPNNHCTNNSSPCSFPLSPFVFLSKFFRFVLIHTTIQVFLVINLGLTKLDLSLSPFVWLGDAWPQMVKGHHGSTTTFLHTLFLCPICQFILGCPLSSETEHSHGSVAEMVPLAFSMSLYICVHFFVSS